MKKFDDLFYEFLRKSQPLAFLASFSMIIAVFAHSNKDIPIPVYNDAATASMMFIISFITSMLGQLTAENDVRNKELYPSTISEAFRYGTYFLFGIGVIYLLLVASEFSKLSLPIPQIVFGWFKLSVGIMTAAVIRLVIKRYREKNYSGLFTGFSIVGLLGFSIPSILLGAADVSGAFIPFTIDQNVQHYLTYTLYVSIGLIISGVIMMKKMKRV